MRLKLLKVFAVIIALEMAILLGAIIAELVLNLIK